MSSAQDIWVEPVIYQIISASISLIASTLTVICIARNRLVTPYRRIIFGLSVSDTCQSFDILAGPWLIQHNASYALWGVGNKRTCQLDGFLYLLGLTAVPMYTVLLCVYYVFKLKNRMSNALFTQKIEKKISLGLCLSAVGTDTINPLSRSDTCTIWMQAQARGVRRM